ncbi:hypothetical protein K505DRAFT_396502 [Melanomma pulvis-pyrius CBS 109.77]|uniref:Uncharacterized protein n=1 Tax=Melanomma pulvis-pyrius CBS 109.77 TaxID=1314802 RepID=A0A6A6XNZ7_9PLEO|nr:hypothetical protein K505DRAFT_396502 [Melanomma pulvis-pyrius CBS 109.77]
MKTPPPLLFNIFYALSLTTTIACLLVAANELKWSRTGGFYQLVTANRASVQIVIQILANVFGWIHVTAICRLINYTTRIRFNKDAISLDTLRAWIALSMAKMDWDLPIIWLLPLVLFIALTLIPSALWAGAITPVSITTVIQSSLQVPSYENVSYIKMWSPGNDRPDSSPLTRNAKGLFTYQVGVAFTANLLFDAASVTVSDSSQPESPHAKFDNTQYAYLGRSYGVGSAAGLGDNFITNNSLATRYAYQEAGYSAHVHCIYNKSNALELNSQGYPYLYSVSGFLPDSPPGDPEYTNCAGVDDKQIVVMSVAHSETSPRRYVAITAGSSYKSLDATQCAIDFTPMLFNVSVSIANRNISVVPAGETADFNPKRNLARTVVRQYSDISATGTNFYMSLIGNALTSSIAGWKLSHQNSSADEATLAGLEQAFLAMTDDMLVAYGSAQLVVGGFSQATTALVHVNALRFGTPGYIYAIFSINSLVVLAFVAEALRTRRWRKLIDFDYLDSRRLVVGSSLGGRGISNAVLQTGRFYTATIV